MFSKVVFFGLLVVVLSVVADEVKIISQDSDIDPEGSFSWNYESADGSKQEENGFVDGEVRGLASWTDPEGGKHEFTYKADEDGYVAYGDDVPVAPEIPAAIARALDWIAAHPQPKE